MGIGPFAKAPLVPVAYAKVAADGTINGSNSGLTTSRLDPGVYEILLPAGMLATAATSFMQIQCWGDQRYNSVELTTPDRFIVQFLDDSGDLADCAFSVMLFDAAIPQ